VYKGETMGIFDLKPGGGPGRPEAMARGLAKDTKRVLDQIRETPGWRVEKGGGGHWKVYPADKTKPMITVADTPSEMRGYQNMLSQLKRAGLDLRPKPPKPMDRAAMEAELGPQNTPPEAL
jgi:hypothetical protein